MFETIEIIGLGYIGLPTATLFASRKKKVIGVDISENAVNTINQGKIHFIEPELDKLVHESVSEGYLHATRIPAPADAFLIAVPTPLTIDQKPDLTYIKSAAKSIAPVLAKGNLVVLESTCPVGTTEKLAEWLALARPDLSFPHQVGDLADIHIAYCPERVLPGQVLRELITNDRIIGGMTLKSSEYAVALYKLFVEGECLVTDVRTAEMCKLTENSFRDINIAFANELSIICDKLEIEVWELIRLANHHPRVNILQPGCGVGGHCIAIDPWFIVDSAPKEANLIRTARGINDSKPDWVIQKVEQAILKLANLGIKTNIRIACLGITYKANIDDLRESPALNIALRLSEQYKSMVDIVEPNLKYLPTELIRTEANLISLEKAIESTQILIVLVDHDKFKIYNQNLRNNQILIDTRGIWKELK